MGRWIVAGVLAAVVVVGLIAWLGDGHWGDGRGWRDTSAEVVTTAEGQTIVIERDRPFFPFFVLIPLLIIGLFWAFGTRRFRDGGWGGGNGPGPQWLNDWHRRQHEQSSTDG